AQFCERLRAYSRRQDAVMHFEHKAGERLMIDFAGKMLSYVEPKTGEVVSCPVFIAVLPFSGYSVSLRRRASCPSAQEPLPLPLAARRRIILLQVSSCAASVRAAG
ncbi:MAG: hypothetical protein KDC66_11710, partial [Phaeodactylibacter sp.]|nr:hypothetical protein [Phaeodactylibacter sp.]